MKYYKKPKYKVGEHVRLYSARELFEKRSMIPKYTNEICHAMFSDTNPIPVKKALNLMGYEMGSLRLPLVELDETRTAQLKKVLEKYNLIEK